MAKYEINYSCGHSERVELYGKHSERESRIEWLQRGVCKDCYRAQQEKARATESAAAAEVAKINGLPELIGSPKQIAWAETIRKNALNDPRNTIPCVPYDLPDDKKRAAEDCRAIMIAARMRLENESSAKWWIDNRETAGGYVRECGRAAIAGAVGKVAA